MFAISHISLQLLPHLGLQQVLGAGAEPRVLRYNTIKNKQYFLSICAFFSAKNYSVVFPHDEPLAGRTEEAGGKRGPLHAELEAAGCVHQERLGWERPGEVFTFCKVYFFVGNGRKLAFFAVQFIHRCQMYSTNNKSG